MSIWSVETVELDDTPTSSSDHPQPSLHYDSDGPCDSTTTASFDWLMSWLELPIPNQSGNATDDNDDIPIGDDYPDQSSWVQQQQEQQELQEQQPQQEQLEQPQQQQGQLEQPQQQHVQQRQEQDQEEEDNNIIMMIIDI